jgi:hypothetical protein
VITVSFSEIDTGRQCEYKWWLAYKERWASKDPAPALAKGTLWHEVMARHYMAIRDLPESHQESGEWIPEDDARDQVIRAVMPLFWNEDGTQSEIQMLVEWMYGGYVSYYGLDSQWEIVAVEHVGYALLGVDDVEGVQYQLKMKIDLAVRERNDPHRRLWLVDHKSGQNLPKDKELAFDDQFGLYLWGQSHRRRRPYGVIYNAARTQRNTTVRQPLSERFERTLLHRTQEELDVIAREAYLTSNRLHRIPSIEWAARSPNPDTCRWRCPFTEPCLAARKGLDIRQLLREREFNQEGLDAVQPRGRRK